MPAPTSPPIPIPLFAERQLQLLLNEHEAEISSSTLATTAASVSASTRRTLQATGYALTGIVLASCRTGLGGRLVGEFTADAAVSSGDDKVDSQGRPRLGAHGIRVGDVVRVNDVVAGGGGTGKRAGKDNASAARKSELQGVVTRVGERSIWIAFDQAGGVKRSRGADEEIEELWGKKLWLIKLANDVTFRRMNQTMKRMLQLSDGDYSHFMRVAFGHTSPLTLDHDAAGPITFFDPSLNESQKEAIRFAMAAPDIALIHGPPGTGKTHTLIELILQMVQRNLRVMVCGPSNVSVDNIVERLAPHKVPVVRMGHPARLLPSVVDHSLEVLTQTSEAAAIVKDIRKEIDDKQASIRKTRSGQERRAIYGDLKELRKEFHVREENCVHTIVRGSKVVLATLHGAGGHQLKDQTFDVVIIDEASQALEAQCWIPLLSARKVVLAGDHLQLPPTVKSTVHRSKKSATKTSEAAAPATVNGHADFSAAEREVVEKITLETTLFDRLLAMHGPDIKRMLTTQYRMHEKIMMFPSNELYEGKLEAAETVKARLLKDLPYEVQDTDDTREPLVFWDTQGGDFPEKTEDEEVGKKEALLGESKSNEMEAALVAKHVDNLVEAGVKAEDIAVITPYNGQLALLSQLLREKYPGIELGSVDGFQGREKEAVVVSLVRSNTEREVGFLAEKRRLNVAMTRPKRHLCVCGDSETISSGGGFLKRWMEFLEEEADLRYPDASTLM